MLTRGMQLGRYEILGVLGQGGMGEVYRARDTRLNRDVAIKVLPEHLAEDPVALKRFQRETEAVAALSHPNILEIHDSGTNQGVTYAVMELLDGETLRAALTHSKFHWRKAVEVAAAIANGINAAHTKGVVHRDLKPENIFLLKDGRIKILDFGLARWAAADPKEGVTDAPTQSQISRFGVVAGTVPYMSPEQIRGEPLDGRSDIFSLGCILYEMISGSRPFSGGSSAEITAAILKDDVPKAENIPQDVRKIINRCLEKNPDLRFHSAHDLVFALKDLLEGREAVATKAPGMRRLSTRATWILASLLAVVALVTGWKFFANQWTSGSSHKIESLAVLPMQNLSGDPKQEYFADGMTEELIAKLARISSLRVISRTSVMEYKNSRKPMPQIAKELNVDALVEGSVLHAGDRVRITAQLIQGATDRHLWADSYERDLQDILALQNEVASSIAKEIQVKLAPEEEARLAHAPKVNPDAYQAYLRGLAYAGGEITKQNIRLAVEMFTKAVDLDRNFALAYAELSRAQSFYYFIDGSPENIQKVKEAADRAFELQPGIPEGHVALGFYYYRCFGDYDRALQEWKIAQKSLPNSKPMLAGMGAVFRRQGKFQQALEMNKKVFALDPRDALSAYDLGLTYHLSHNYPEAQKYFEICIALRPDQGDGYYSSAENLIYWKGDTKGARAIMNRAPQSKVNEYLLDWYLLEMLDRNYAAALNISSKMDDGWFKDFCAGRAYLLMNKLESAKTFFENAQRILENKVQKTPDEYRLHAALGICYAALGRKYEAIREGKRAVEILPVSKDEVWGADMVLELAYTYTLVGEQDAAIDQLAYLLSIPSNISVSVLRVDPRFDPLRNNPRFKKLLER